MKSKFDSIEKLEGALIVSCQADHGEPLSSKEMIAALSLSVVSGGASALRLEGVENIRYVASVLKQHKLEIPILGLTKIHGLSVDQRLDQAYITPQFSDAEALAHAGADVIALDATGRPFKDGSTLKEAIDRIHSQLKKPVMADVATLEQGMAAAEYGADLISTTLFGYTRETILGDDAGPGFDLLSRMLGAVTTPVIMEGRVWSPDELEKAFALGAYSVVVGSAITRPHYITRRFVKAIPQRFARPELGSQKA